MKTFWAGFVDGKLCVDLANDGYGNTKMLCLYLSEKEAKRRFEDIRKVIVSESNVQTSQNKD